MNATVIKGPEVEDNVNIHWCRHEEVAAFLESKRQEDGHILIHDVPGTCTQWEQGKDHRTIQPVESSRSHSMLVKDFAVFSGINAAGPYKRVVIRHGTILRIVEIINGVPSVNLGWVPTNGL